jgi:taurine dioxygenase
MDFKLKRLSNYVGAEVTGLDLSKPVSAEVKTAINAAWTEHAVLVFRDQALTPPQFAEAAEIFGVIMQQQLTKFLLPDHPKVGTISSRDLPIVDGKLHVRG